MRIIKIKTCTFSGSEGFTLIEVVVVLLVSALIMTGVYKGYRAQQRTYTAQEAVVEMQQNIRAALGVMMRGVRMAGYDRSQTAMAGISIALPGQMSYTQDITNIAGTATDGDGVPIVLDANGVPLSGAGPGEVTDFGFRLADDPGRDGMPDSDLNGDGVPDAVSFGRQNDGAGGYQAIAENIQAIEFLYLDSTATVTANLNNIRSIQISILARASRADPDYTNVLTYTPASGVPWDLNGAATGRAANDNFRRRLLISTVQCRNMGL